MVITVRVVTTRGRLCCGAGGGVFIGCVLRFSWIAGLEFTACQPGLAVCRARAHPVLRLCPRMCSVLILCPAAAARLPGRRMPQWSSHPCRMHSASGRCPRTSRGLERSTVFMFSSARRRSSTSRRP